ncbi:solute carrier family 25 member 47 isoform X5 [Meleagris gallopavo]|uniref:solute carrier family 25 member 47 isoform X5 n=2 Tax=Meleagris gallopavo TaxID=9103 RepID=UPI0012ABA6DB|nr:solute carrier family 25 member 47 isoform X5 [Meleagris gallopavo]
MRKLPCDLERKLPMLLHLLLDVCIDDEQLHIFLVPGAPGLDAIHPMETCKCRVEGDSHLKQSAVMCIGNCLQNLSVSGGLSTAVGYPLDTVKVRIQTEGHYNGIWHCIQETYRTERVLGFYRGVSASVFSVSLISSVSFGTYRNFLCNICKLRYGTADAKPSGLDVSLAGGAAGAVRVVLMTPSEVAKVRMQTQRNPHSSVTSSQPLSKPKYRGSLHCLKVIAKEEGFGGLYKGCSALLCRDCSSSAIYFLTYSSLCDWLTPAGKNKPGFLVVLLSGGSAGVLAWGLATPLDVLKSRMQVDESGQHRYKGLIHCARESVRKEGLKVLFKGLGLNCIRAFPVNMVVFVTYEAVLRFTEHFTNKK